MKRTKRKLRASKKRILILCEGKTEKNYFQAIKEDEDFKKALSAVNPQVVAAKNSAPEDVIREAMQRAKKEKREGNPYSKVWVVFDHDNHKNRKTAFDVALENEFEIAFSAICFEQWYLLHFFKSSRIFTSANSLIKILKKHYPNYSKAKQNDFNFLKDKLEIAFENSNWLRKQNLNIEKHITDRNPWTDVDNLVKELINLP